jgi:iron complex transport system substrate-binding protein
MRIVSLLPAATEIVAALGKIDDLVGVSHECNFPDAVNRKPRVTGCEIHGTDIASCQIDGWVSERLANGQAIFTLDEPLLRDLRPDLILTQRLCDVCAPAYGSVAALAESLPGPPKVLNLEPSRLDDVFQNIGDVAAALGIHDVGVQVVEHLRSRVARVERQAESMNHRPRVAVIEWLDPVFCSGHWTPELVEIAGGVEVLGQKGKDSVRKTWEDVARSEPEILMVACCGQSAERALHDWGLVSGLSAVRNLPAVRNGRVYFADGNAYFSRPGPRLVDSLEILAQTIEPEIHPLPDGLSAALRLPETGPSALATIDDSFSSRGQI